MDFNNLHQFYNSELGKCTQGFLEQKIKSYVDVKSDTVITGVGYTAPFLLNLEQGDTKLSLVPEFIENFNVVGSTEHAVCEEDHLPLLNNSSDLCLMVHCLEHSNSPWGLMAEINRILPSGGRVVVVVPNRVGLWARRTNNPFGFGRSYTKGQLKKLMLATGFVEITTDYSVYNPPLHSLFNSAIANFCENWMKYVLRENSGVIIGVYEKQVHKYVESKNRVFKVPIRRPKLAVNKDY